MLEAAVSDSLEGDRLDFYGRCWTAVCWITLEGSGSEKVNKFCRSVLYSEVPEGGWITFCGMASGKSEVVEV